MKHTILKAPRQSHTLKFLPLAFAVLAGLTTLACSKKTESSADITTAETVKAQTQVNSYANNNTEEQKKKVEVALIALDQEIKELELRVEATAGENKAEAEYKLVELKKRRSEIKSDYTEAKFNALVEDIKNAVR